MIINVRVHNLVSPPTLPSCVPLDHRFKGQSISETLDLFVRADVSQECGNNASGHVLL